MHSGRARQCGPGSWSAALGGNACFSTGAAIVTVIGIYSRKAHFCPLPWSNSSCTGLGGGSTSNDSCCGSTDSAR
jgi:hypothetical protein